MGSSDFPLRDLSLIAINGAVQCGNEPGPIVVGCGADVAGLLAWLGGLDIEVAEPLPPVCVGAYMVATSADAVMLRMLVDAV
jgi:hypothetical protein